MLHEEATGVQTTHRMPIASTTQHSMMEDINEDINKDVHRKYYWHSMMEDIKPAICQKVKVHHYKIYTHVKAEGKVGTINTDAKTQPARRSSRRGR